MTWVKSQISRYKESIGVLSTDAEGRFLLCGSEKGEAYLWSLEDNNRLISKGEGLAEISSTAISWDGNNAALVSKGLWLAKIDEDFILDEFVIPDSYPRSVAFIPQSNSLVVALYKGFIIIDADNRVIVTSKEHSDANYLKIRISRDGQWLAGINKWATTVHLWDIRRPRKHKKIGNYEKPIADIAFVGTNHIAVVCHEIDGHLWDLSSRKTIRSLPIAQGLAVNSDSSFIALSQEFNIRVESVDGEQAEILKSNGYLWDLIEVPESEKIIAVGGGEIVRWSRETPKSSLARRVYESEDWINLAVTYYQGLGFFKDTRNLSEFQPLESIVNKFASSYKDSISESTELNLVLLLALDLSRVWWGDSEVVDNDEAYTEVLQQWAEISLGNFELQGIQEVWSDNGDTITITLTLQNTPYRIQPRVSGDWLDLSILGEINELIEETGYQFILFSEPRDQTAIVACTTKETREKLQQDLGITFEATRR